MPYQLLADLVLIMHAAFVTFVLVGQLLIVAGAVLHWLWVVNWWFRLAHLGAIGVVVAQAWLGILCPLTHLEMWLRRQAGDAHYSGSFIQFWIQKVLYYQAPDWVFVTLYTGFGLLVVVSWALVPPLKRG